MHLPQLKRLRWYVRLALILAIAASVAANVLHARQNPISQIISAWPPLALLLTVELTSRIPMHKPLLATARVLATTVIASIAAWVSYWHMQGVAVRYGETETSAYLLPISVDGLIVVASVSLVELTGRIRMIEDEMLAARATTGVTTAAAGPGPAPLPGFRRATSASPAAPVSPAVVPVARPLAHANGVNGNGASGNGSRPTVSAAVSAPPRTVVTASTSQRDSHDAPGAEDGSTPASRPATESNAPRQRRPVQETANLADEIEAMHPEITETELARRLGITATRLRTVRREAREARRSAALAAE